MISGANRLEKMVSSGKLWLGSAGTGKTTALVRELEKCAAAGGRDFVIVGELSGKTRQNLKDRTLRRIRDASLGELAREILDHHGTHLALMTPAQRGTLIWKASKHSGVPMEKLEEIIGFSKGGRTPRPLRSKRAKNALKEYEQQKKGRNLFDEYDVLRELLWRLKEQIRSTDLSLTLVVDQYESLSPIEHEAVKALLRRGAQILAAADPAMAFHPAKPCVGWNGTRQLSALSGIEATSMRTPYRLGQSGVSVLRRLLSDADIPEKTRGDWARQGGGFGVEVSAAIFDTQEEEIQTICQVAQRGAPITVISNSAKIRNRIEEAFLANRVQYQRCSESTIHKAVWLVAVDLLEALYQGKEEHFRALISKSSFDRRSWRKLSKEHELPADPAVAIVREAHKVRQLDHEAALLAEMLERFRGDRFSPHLADEVCGWAEASFGDPKDVEPIRMRCLMYVRDGLSNKEIIEDVHGMLHRAAAIESGEMEMSGSEDGVLIATPHEASMLDLRHVWIPSIGNCESPSSRKAAVWDKMMLYRAISRASKSIILSGFEGGREEDLLTAVQGLGDQYACSA
jgi:hypothetical protein